MITTKNILLRGSPATGKTLYARALSYYLCHEKIQIEDAFNRDVFSDMDAIEEFVHSEYCEFIQVHPSMSYEDIVFGIQIKASGDLQISHVEKRVKELCDRAAGSADLYCIIFDDINRANASALLGNLIYAMEYRGQPVELLGGNTLTIPTNVILIFTECSLLSGNDLDFTLRRRMEYVKELRSDREILDGYYDDAVGQNAKTIILDVYDSIKNYIERNIARAPDIHPQDYFPGHGMFIVECSGTPYLILDKVKQKVIHQVFPYMIALYGSGILTGDLYTFFEQIKNRINTGVEALSNVTSIQKVLINSGRVVTPFTLTDSRDYYANTIIPAGCVEHKGIIENVIDAIILNGIFPYDVSLSSLLTNINVARVESHTIPTEYASYLVEADRADRFAYSTPTPRGTRVTHAYYSSRPPKNGRWKSENDTIAYRVAYTDGTPDRLFLPLNGVRSHYFTFDNVTVHPANNTAEVYGAIYRLIDAYLRLYSVCVSLIMGSNHELLDLYNLIELERKYLTAIHDGLKNHAGDKAKTRFFGSKIINFRTLWNQRDSRITVDMMKFDDLVYGRTAFSLDEYEDIFNITGTTKTITLRGVNRMAELKEYQRIMENIGVRQMIFQGPPGTSKTFDSKKFVLEQLYEAAPALAANFVTQEDISRDLANYKLTEADYAHPETSAKLATGGWDIVQFHPSYGYEDFVRGIEVSAVGGSPTYASVNRILGKIAEFARYAASTNQDTTPKFYLIIDEINRANLATVFGELIYGLEYRNSAVSTPYEVNDKVIGAPSRDIVLPKNLFIIGTMNTADKSIDSIDYAIRRRFIFIDSPANRDIVISCYQHVSGKNDEDSIELLLFDAVQKLFEGDRFFNNEYQRNDVKIGHTYFLRDRATGYEAAVAQHFVYQVIPILREYLKDGILETIEELVEHSVNEIYAAPDRDEQIKLISENIMLYIKEFGNVNANGDTINNEYISNFVEELRIKFHY